MVTESLVVIIDVSSADVLGYSCNCIQLIAAKITDASWSFRYAAFKILRHDVQSTKNDAPRSHASDISEGGIDWHYTLRLAGEIELKTTSGF